LAPRHGRLPPFSTHTARSLQFTEAANDPTSLLCRRWSSPNTLPTTKNIPPR
jgi:hypothetical protein